MDANGLQTVLRVRARIRKRLSPRVFWIRVSQREEVYWTSPSEGSVHEIDRAQVGDVEDCDGALCRPLDSLPTSQARAARQ